MTPDEDAAVATAGTAVAAEVATGRRARGGEAEADVVADDFADEWKPAATAAATARRCISGEAEADAEAEALADALADAVADAVADGNTDAVADEEGRDMDTTWPAAGTGVACRGERRSATAEALP